MSSIPGTETLSWYAVGRGVPVGSWLLPRLRHLGHSVYSWIIRKSEQSRGALRQSRRNNKITEWAKVRRSRRPHARRHATRPRSAPCWGLGVPPSCLARRLATIAITPGDSTCAGCNECSWQEPARGMETTRLVELLASSIGHPSKSKSRLVSPIDCWGAGGRLHTGRSRNVNSERSQLCWENAN